MCIHCVEVCVCVWFVLQLCSMQQQSATTIAKTETRNITPHSSVYFVSEILFKICGAENENLYLWLFLKSAFESHWCVVFIPHFAINKKSHRRKASCLDNPTVFSSARTQESGAVHTSILHRISWHLHIQGIVISIPNALLACLFIYLLACFSFILHYAH